MRLAILMLALLAAAAPAEAGVTLTHVHGLAYDSDGKRLMVPSHDGLALYERGQWSMAPGPRNDYMGFSATRDQLYSSGHPAPGSRLVNPFGLIRSSNGGRTWDKLGLEGEADFHLLATGWNTNAIYVWSPAPNSRMRAPGLYHSPNDGFMWARTAASGLEGELHALAVHPNDAAVVAAATSRGVFLSKDSGEHFSTLVPATDAYSVMFDLDGQRLWFGTFGGGAALAVIDIGRGRRTQISLPEMGRDAVAFIAQNPAKRSEIAVATFQRSVYLSADGGRGWKQIAKEGRGL